jgi:WD40 repeat protein
MILDVLTMRTDSLHTPAASSVSWSPDGRSIAFAATNVGTHGTGALGIVQPDGSGMQIVAPDLGVYSVTSLAWSPDGNSLAVVLINENGCPWYCDTALGVVNRDGTGLRIVDQAHTCFMDAQCVPTESYIVGDPEWTDDGARIAYTVLPGKCYDSGLIGECGDIMSAGVNDGSVGVLVKIAGLPSWRR